MKNGYCALHIAVILSREPHKWCRSAKCEESPFCKSCDLGALTEYKAFSERKLAHERATEGVQRVALDLNTLRLH